MQILPSEPGYRESHYANLELFCPNRDGTFTVPIREKPSGHGEQNEGNGEEGTCHSNEPVTIALLDRSAEDDEDDEILV
jgi:hypothetical protein